MTTPSGVFRKDLYYDKTGYTPHPGQAKLHYTPSRFKVISCGRRYGKTVWGAKEIEPCSFVPSRGINGGPQLGWIVGPNYVHAEKEFGLVYDSLRKLGIDKDALKFQNNVDSGSLHIKTSWGFELIGKSAEHPQKLVGDGLDFVLMAEAGLHKRKTWAQYIRPALSDRRGWGAFTGVPEGMSHHSLLFSLYQRGMDPSKRLWSSFTARSWENTLVFPGGREDPEILEAEDDLTEDEFRRQYGAEFVDHVGVVMQEWDEDYHVTDIKYNPDWPLYAACDYGYRDPFVWLWIQVDERNNVYVLEEHRFTEKDPLEIVDELRSRDIGKGFLSKCRMFYPDPSRPDTTATLVNSLKLKAGGNTGGERNVRDQLIRKGLKPKNMKIFGMEPRHPEDMPGLLVDRSCDTGRWEMREGYRWPEHKSEIKGKSERPMDKDDHFPEALGRFYKGHFGAPSENMEPERTRQSRVSYR